MSIFLVLPSCSSFLCSHPVNFQRGYLAWNAGTNLCASWAEESDSFSQMSSTLRLARYANQAQWHRFSFSLAPRVNWTCWNALLCSAGLSSGLLRLTDWPSSPCSLLHVMQWLIRAQRQQQRNEHHQPVGNGQRSQHPSILVSKRPNFPPGG